MNTLEDRVSAIEERNKKVEADKAWETSWIRMVLLSVLTYLLMVLFMWSADLSRPFTNAIIPSLAFVLSTLSFPAVKKWWIRRFNR
jgi:hypothetical protein